MPPEEEKTATLIEHLEELRLRLIRSLVAVAILMPAAWPVSQIAIEWMKRSFFPSPDLKLYFSAPMELFFLRMKVSVALGVVVAIPYIAWQIWGFVAPALYKKERGTALALALSSSFFFILGASFALFGIFPMLMKYSFAMSSPDIQPLYGATPFIGTAAMLMLAFGFCFQLPLAVFILVRSGIVELESMRSARSYVIVGIFIVAGVITPPDMISMLALALPTVGLFELSLIAASWAGKRKAALEAQNGEKTDA